MVGTHCRVLKSSAICSLWRQIRLPGLFRRFSRHLYLPHLALKPHLHLKFTTVITNLYISFKHVILVFFWLEPYLWESNWTSLNQKWKISEIHSVKSWEIMLFPFLLKIFCSSSVIPCISLICFKLNWIFKSKLAEQLFFQYSVYHKKIYLWPLV